MDAKEEFEKFKKEVEKEQVKRARKIATVFGVLAVIALIALVFAFFQSAESQRTRMLAEKQATECNENEKNLRDEMGRLEAKVNQLTEELNAAMNEAERQSQPIQKKDPK